MKTPHKHAEIIKAWADGEPIQFYYDEEKEWKDCDLQPSWHPLNLYRIKPEPKPDVVFYGVAINESGIARVHYLGMVNGNIDNNLKLTFDGETGKLKAAEVLK